MKKVKATLASSARTVKTSGVFFIKVSKKRTFWKDLKVENSTGKGQGVVEI